MNRRHLLFSLASLAVVGTAACGNDQTNPSPIPPTGSAPFSATDLRVGTGATAQVGQTITVAYAGWLYSDTAPENKGTQFEPRQGGGQATFRPVIGVGQVIRGWDQGIPGMRVGGLRRLVIPPELAYGSSANGPIPPNATLLFEVELLSIP